MESTEARKRREYASTMEDAVNELLYESMITSDYDTFAHTMRKHGLPANNRLSEAYALLMQMGTPIEVLEGFEDIRRDHMEHRLTPKVTFKPSVTETYFYPRK